MKYLLFLTLLLFVNLLDAQELNDYLGQAQTAFEKSDYEEAMFLSNLAVLEDSTDVRPYLLIAQSLIELDAHQKAYDVYSYAISILPDEASLYSRRGLLLYSSHQFNQAIEDYNKAIELTEKDSIKCYRFNERAVAKIGIRDFLGAYEDLKIAYSLDSTNLAVLNNLGPLCDELNKGREALKYLLKVVEIDSTFYSAYVNIGFRYQGLGKYQLAIQYYNKTLEIEPDEPLAYSNRSYCKLKLGDLKAAMADIERSISLYPTNCYAYRNRAMIYIENNKLNEACDDLTTALEKGFTEMYGNEVIDLREQHCRKRKK